MEFHSPFFCPAVFMREKYVDIPAVFFFNIIYRKFHLTLGDSVI